MSQECQCKVRQHEGRRAEDREEQDARAQAMAAFDRSFVSAPGSWTLALDAALTAYRAALCEIALRRLGVRGTR